MKKTYSHLLALLLIFTALGAHATHYSVTTPLPLLYAKTV